MKATEKPTRDDVHSLSSELAALTKQQYGSLQKSSYINMTQSDADAYNKRRLRIGELCELLAKCRRYGS